MRRSVAILGAGAWGTALAIHLVTRATAAPRVMLWARDAAQAQAIASERVNRRYLPGVALPPDIEVTSDLARAARADILLAATPVAALAELVASLVGTGTVIAWRTSPANGLKKPAGSLVVSMPQIRMRGRGSRSSISAKACAMAAPAAGL